MRSVPSAGFKISPTETPFKIIWKRFHLRPWLCAVSPSFLAHSCIKAVQFRLSPSWLEGEKSAGDSCLESIGGVAGGASVAARARRLSEDAHIVLFERGPDVSFANCGLPYYLGGEISERDKLLVATPERLRTRFKLDVRVRTSVEAIDRAAKKVRVRDLASGREYEESYDKLILAPGAAPICPPLPGIDLPGVFTLRNLQDLDRIQAKLDQGVRQAVVVGAGFIGPSGLPDMKRGCTLGPLKSRPPPR
jgi:hypothetical protein